MTSNIFEQLLAAIEAGQRCALGIISGVKGSSPQKRGAKALFFEDGRIVGTLGGGCLEAEVRRRALAALETGEPEAFDLLLDHDFGWDDGLICGGKVAGLILPNLATHADLWRKLARRDETVVWGVRRDFRIGTVDDDEALYLETAQPPEHLWIAGAGHIARAVAPLAAGLDFRVTVFDDRPALARGEHFPGARLRVDYWDKLLEEPLPDAPALGLIVTRGHQHDALVLSRWATKPFAFLGMIGSLRKRRIIFERFLSEGLATAEQLERVACPVGLDIQAISPQEIAVSIVAQLIENRARRAAAALPELRHA